MTPPLPAASAAAVHRGPPRPVRTLLRVLLLAAGVAALAGCFRELELEPLQPEPGIVAALSVVQGRTQTLFAELESAPGLPFAQAEAIHYRPLLADLARARELARVHEREPAERRDLDALEATYDALRARHREGALDVQTRQDFRRRLDAQLDALLRRVRG